MKGMRTQYPARIVDFDPLTMTATVKLVIEAYISDLEESYQRVAPLVLKMVPVHFPRGGGYSITMPVKPNDDCLVFFMERGYDHWVYDGLTEVGLVDGYPDVGYKRRFDASDAMCIIGFGSGLFADTPAVIADFQVEAIEVRNVDRTTRLTITGVDAGTTDNAIEVATPNAVDVQAANLTGHITENTTLVIDGQTDITCPIINLTGDVTIDGLLHVTKDATYDANVTVVGAVAATGAVSSGAGITAAGDVKAGNISMQAHTHKYFEALHKGGEVPSAVAE